MTRSSTVLALTVAALSVAFLCRSSSGAPASTEQFQITDRAQPRVFEIAVDELQINTPDHRQMTLFIEPQASYQAIRAKADALRQATGDDVELVLYEAGQPHGLGHRRALTKQVLVEIAAGTSAQTVADTVGATGWAPAAIAEGYFIFKTTETAGALTLAQNLRIQPGVLSAEPMLAKQHSKRLVPTDNLFTNQWHLRNTGQGGGTAGNDINVVSVWDRFRGEGIRIGVIDDGLQFTHPDLAPNYDATFSTNLNTHTADPTPSVLSDFHGTACAGLVGARGTNGLGVVGAAFNASIGGIRILGGNFTDADEAAAENYRKDIVDIMSNSWGPDDDGFTIEGPGTLAAAAFAQGVATGRGGKGTIYVWAGGNGRQFGDDANRDGYANSIYTIAIGAVDDQGKQSDYSESGACLVVSAPSSSQGRQGLISTDLLSDDGYNFTGAPSELADKNYTQQFGGTSGATPIAAGVIGLMLQANPNLGWRDVQEILLRSATKNNSADTDWITNAAGFNFNHKYGAGLINAAGAVALATNWSNLGVRTNFSISASGLNFAIPDGDPAGFTGFFTVPSNINIRVEQVAITFTITHSFRGDLGMIMTAPSGTKSVLVQTNDDSNNNFANWKVMTVRDWGETVAGQWFINIHDDFAGAAGTLTAIKLDIYGVIPAPNNTADLVLTNSATPDPVMAGDFLTYVLGVQNKGPTNATGVILTDTLPKNVNVVSAVASQGTVNNFGTNIVCNLGSLITNATATVTLTVTPTQPGILTNVASVVANQPDHIATNNSVSTVVTALAQIFNVKSIARPASAILSWDTLTNTLSQIEYGFSTNYGYLTPLEVVPSTNHAVLLEGLTTATNFYFGVIAYVGTNVVRAGPFSFSTDPNIYVDNPQATYSGNWTLGNSATDKFGAYYQSATTINSIAPSAVATYAPNISAAGKYDVAVWYPSGLNRTTNAPVTVVNDTDSQTFQINEAANGGVWRTLVTGWSFSAGTAGFATVANNTSDPGKVVMADAFRWTYVTSQDNTPAGTVPDWWATYYFGGPVDGNLDPDGDGISTYGEYVAGTSPTNSASHLLMTSEPTPTGLKITFSPAQGGRIYRLSTSSALQGGSWSPLPDAPVVNATTGEFNVTLDGAAARFYRVSVELAQ